MAPFYKTAAAFCLVGLFGLQCGAQTPAKYKFEVAQVDEDAYLTVKLARNGQISAKTSSVEMDDTIVTALETKVKTGESTKNACEDLIKDHLKTIFYHSFEYTATPNYRTLVQEALTTGLTEFGKTYPENASAWQGIWQNENVHSLLHLLGADSTKVGCVIGNCVKSVEEEEEEEGEGTFTKSVLFCELKPAPTTDSVAFSEEYFKEISTRTTELKSMTEEDLKDPTVTSSADAVVPSILTAGLVAILAAISA